MWIGIFQNQNIMIFTTHVQYADERKNYSDKLETPSMIDKFYWNIHVLI